MTNFIRIVSGLEKIEVAPLDGEARRDLPESHLFQLDLSHRAQSRLEFLDVYPPSVALHLPDVFVWAGTRLYRQRLERGSSQQVMDFDHELLAIYPLATSWCLVFETLLEVRDQRLQLVRQRFDLMEIILEHEWENEVLNLRDLRGRSFAFSSQKSAGSLVQISGDALDRR